MRRIAAMIKKEFYQIRSDKFMLRFLIMAPLLQLIILGYSLTMETEHVKTIICDLDKTSASRQFIEEVSNNDRFDIIGSTDSYESLESEIRDWNAVIGIYIPPDFSENLVRNGDGEMLAVLDGVNGNQALTAFGYLSQIAVETSREITPVHILRKNLARGGNIRINPHYWYNPELKNQVYMVPGIVVFIITIITLILSSMTIVKEKEMGTLEQLMVTPMNRIQFILGKQIPFLIYSFIELIIILKFAELIFNIHMAGSILNLYLVIFFYLFTTLGLGLFVSTVARTQQQALFLTWFVMVVVLMLSGFFIPIDNMPTALKYITLLNPLRYMMTTVREIYLKASPLSCLADQILPLIVLGITIFIASIASFRKRVS